MVGQHQPAAGLNYAEGSNVIALEIELLPAAAAERVSVMSSLTELINDVYLAAEKGLWLDGIVRTTAGELAGYTRAQEIAVATVDGAIAGCVRVQRLTQELGEFGMLAGAPHQRGLGIGRELIRFAEAQMRGAGCRTMQLELLVPQEWTHPSKKFLHDWYTRLGYHVVRVEDPREALAHLAPNLATPCDFRIYHKELGAH